MMKRALALLAAILAGCLAPCAAQNVSVAPRSAMPFQNAALYVNALTPPPAYQRWYTWAEHCTRLQGDYAGVHWLTADHPWGVTPDTTFAMWQKDGRRITLNKQEMMDSALVIHESIHDIVGLHPEYPDTAVHPKEFYRGQCSWQHHGDLVTKPVRGAGD